MTVVIYGDTLVLKDIVIGNGPSDPSSNLGKVVCISNSTNILGKHMHPNILLQATCK